MGPNNSLALYIQVSGHKYYVEDILGLKYNFLDIYAGRASIFFFSDFWLVSRNILQNVLFIDAILLTKMCFIRTLLIFIILGSRK